MANLCLRIPEIRVEGKTNTSRSAALSGKKRRRVFTKGDKMRQLPFAKLTVLAASVSILAALFLAALPDFRPDIVPFQARVAMFTVRYTVPVCSFQLAVFWILYLIRKR
jgi:hypothetical protein